MPPWHAAPPRDAGAAAPGAAVKGRGAVATGRYGAGNGCCADEPCESASNAAAAAIATRIPDNGIGIRSPLGARVLSTPRITQNLLERKSMACAPTVLVSSPEPYWHPGIEPPEAIHAGGRTEDRRGNVARIRARASKRNDQRAAASLRLAVSRSTSRMFEQRRQERRSGANAAHRSCIRTDVKLAGIVQERTSKIMLNGVSVARRNRWKPASVATWRSLRSPACAPSPQPTSCDSDAGVQMKVDA